MSNRTSARAILTYCQARARGSEAAARPVSRTALDAVLLPEVGCNLHRDPAESFVWVRLRVVRDRIRVAEVLANALESLHLLLPGLGEVRPSASPLRDALEHAARNRVL